MPHCEHAAITTDFRTGAFLPPGVADQISKKSTEIERQVFSRVGWKLSKMAGSQSVMNDS
jgi:hypothetical protein